MKNQKSKQFVGAVSPAEKPQTEKQTPEQAEFDEAFSGPYEEQAEYVKPRGLRLTTPTCPPLPEELESKVHETLVNYAPGEVVAAFAIGPHTFSFVTYPSGKKFKISR